MFSADSACATLCCSLCALVVYAHQQVCVRHATDEAFVCVAASRRRPCTLLTITICQTTKVVLLMYQTSFRQWSFRCHFRRRTGCFDRVQLCSCKDSLLLQFLKNPPHRFSVVQQFCQWHGPLGSLTVCNRIFAAARLACLCATLATD